MIWARVRAGAIWSDVCILNLSSRGMLVRAGKAPARGTYLEIRRGAHLVVARVVWAESERFGVQTQDAYSPDALIHHPDNSARQATSAVPGPERRTAHRSPAATSHETSRWRARVAEFATFVLVGAVAATLGLGAVEVLLARPLEAIQMALGER